MATPDFHFKRCSIVQEGVTHPVGTDAVLLGAWADIAGARRILDIGTGTGVIALMLAQRTENQRGIQIDAVEIHPDSAMCAGRNFAASPWADHLNVFETTIQNFAEIADNQYDLIISNPPFFSEKTKAPDETRRLGRHTATLPPNEMLAAVNKLLTPNGRFVVVLPVQEGWRLCESAVPAGLYWTLIAEVRGRREKPVERLLIEFQRDPYPFRKESILIYEDGLRYSTQYQELTQDFYL
ncbi:MAG TPA: methyltransferase [Saprospiraceae bacterium]|nr:methyltransferase [Saprospiraceae bacterium]HPI07154.1 methyltransferase [Saprospiraceae bacterium]